MGKYFSKIPKNQECNATKQELINIGYGIEDECRSCADFYVRCKVSCHREAAGT